MSWCGSMDTITGQAMMISRTKISAEGFEKVEITAKMAEVFGLPKKAVGKWAVVSKDYFEYRLRKVRLDGYFADDKYNNHQRIPNRIWDEMFGSKSMTRTALAQGANYTARQALQSPTGSINMGGLASENQSPKSSK